MLKRNIAANFVGRFWGVLSLYLFIPYYLKYLGTEEYGLVGFYSTLMGVIAFTDLGLTATINREMARLSGLEGKANTMRELLRTYEIIYSAISLLLGVLIWLLAPFIASRWLHAKFLSQSDIIRALIIMGLAIAFQMPSGLFIGGLQGLQKQVRINILQISWGVIRGVGAVLVLRYVSSTIIAFVSWQLVSNILYFLATRRVLWHSIPRVDKYARFNVSLVKATWRYAIGMALMSIIAIILTQADRVILSSRINLAIFGYYTLAYSLAAVPIMLANPIGTAIFPRFTIAVAKKDFATLKVLYHNSSSLTNVVVFPVTMIIAFFSAELLYAWTGSISASESVSVVGILLVIGQAMQAMTLIPYYVFLAQGNVRFNLLINSAATIVIIPILSYLISKYGVLGAGMSWLLINSCILPIYMVYFHGKYMRGEFRNWIVNDVGIPLAASFIITFAFWSLRISPTSRIGILGYVAGVWGCATIVSGLSVPIVRGKAKNIITIYIKKRFKRKMQESS